jgi:transposase
LRPLLQTYAGTGTAALAPGLLLKAVLYQTQQGPTRPADWHRAARESGPVRWLLRGCLPSRSCWYTFRDRLGPLLGHCNAQVLALAVDAGLTTACRGCLDGTTIAANASRHRLVNAPTLDKRLAERTAATAADAAVPPPEPAAVPGAAAAPAWMAKTPAGRRRQHGRLRQARQRLHELQGRNRAKRASKRKPAEKIVVSLSDPESLAGRDKEKVFRPLYNVQVVDDVDSPLVLAYEVFAQPNDAGLLPAMLTRLRELTGRLPRALLADTAYAGGADLAAAARQGVTVDAPLPADAGDKAKHLPKSRFCWLELEQTYACPQGHRLRYEGTSRAKRWGTEAVQLARYRCPPTHCAACPLRSRCTPGSCAGRTISRGQDEAHIEALRQRMSTPEAQQLYRRRSQTVELVNADWKEYRGLRRFSGRGRERARCQVGLAVLAHNLLTVAARQTAVTCREATPLPAAANSDPIGP